MCVYVCICACREISTCTVEGGTYNFCVDDLVHELQCIQMFTFILIFLSISVVIYQVLHIVTLIHPGFQSALGHS
jgi:hypothetical protein